jgi:hypothetical protein
LRSGAEDCTFETGFQQLVDKDDLSGEFRVEDIREVTPDYHIGCRISFDLTAVSSSDGEVHAKAVDIPVVSPLCDTPYRDPTELRDVCADPISPSSFAVFAWEPSYEVCVRASFGWASPDFADINPAETPMGWLIDVDLFRVEQEACNAVGASPGMALRVPSEGGIWGSATFQGGDAGQLPDSIDLDLTANMVMNYHWVPPRVHFGAKGLPVNGC